MTTEIIRVAFGLMAVLGLIGICAVVARKAGVIAASGGLIRQRRLKLVETLSLDSRRRVAIVRCDDRDHLILLGANNDTVISGDIEALAPTDTNSDGAIVDDENSKMPVPKRDNPFAILRALQKHKDEAEKTIGDLEKSDAA